jgi:hypothetical protein
MRSILKLLILIGLIGLSSAAVSADSSASVTQTYNANSSVLPGMIVELKAGAPNTVTPLVSQDLSRMLGVVVPVNDAPLVLSSPVSSGQQVLVATTGRYDLLVSNQGGVIKAGDYLTVSSLAGIGMKASSAQAEIIGQAVGNFNGSSNVLGTVPLKTSQGGSVTESIGTIAVNVKLAANPTYQKSNDSRQLPSFLSKSANAIASKPVSAPRVYLGALILLATFFIAGSLLYGGARSGLQAIGRNPLAKQAINRSLFKIVLGGLAVLLIGFLAVYLILRV